MDDLAWMSLAVLSVSHPDHIFRLEVSHPIEWTEWNLQRILIVHLRLWMWTLHFLWWISLPLHGVFLIRFPMSPSFPTPQCLRSVRHPSRFHPRFRAYPRNNPGKTFFPNWWIIDWSFAVIGWYSTNEPNWIICPLNGSFNHLGMVFSPQTSDLECFEDRYSIPWNLPTIFHPDLTATKLQCTFFHSANCSLTNPMYFRSVWCRRTMIPGKIFTGFAKFQGTVSVSDFKLPIRLQELCKLLCVSRQVFVLHGYDWIHWVAKSCTTTAYRWLFRDSQPSLRNLLCAVIKSPKFSARSTTPPVRLLHGAFVIFGPLADLAISVFWEVSINTVFTQIRTSRTHRL